MKKFSLTFISFFKQNKRYLFLSTLCIVGYVWLLNEILNPVIHNHYGVCFSKQIYGISCPACGTTRSVLFILNGELWNALAMNPFGYLAVLFLIYVPLALIYDFVRKRNHLIHLYEFFESKIKEPKIFFLFTVIILANWVWNILKDN